MSDSLTASASSQRTSSDQKNSLQVWVTLLRKEFRETGYYGITIMLGGILVIALGLFGSGFASSQQEGITYINFMFGLAKAFPMLVVLSCGAALFSIEHENGSYRLLRSLPIAPLTLFWIKLLLLVLLIVVSCIVFWPIAYFLTLFEPSVGKGFIQSLPTYSVGMLEAMLWALMFSLREKKVIQAIIMSGLCYFFTANGLAVISLIDISNRDTDQYFFWGILIARFTIGISLFILIARSSVGWLGDKPTSSSKAFSGRPAIETDVPVRLASWKRLVWLQWRANWVPLLTLGLINLAIVLYTSDLGKFFEPHPTPNHGIFLWSITVVLLSFFAAKSAGKQKRMLVCSGYPPRKIWLAHCLSIFGFCTISAVLFYFTVPMFNKGEHLFAWYYFYHLMISFSVAQFAALLCRNFITGLVAAGLLASLAFFLFSVSKVAFVHQIPALIVLAGLPLVLVAFYSKSRATTGHLGMRFWLIAPTLFCLSLIPLPFLRIYEAPDAEVSNILAEFSQPTELSSEQLSELRRYGDQLIGVEQRIRKARSTNDQNVPRYLTVSQYLAVSGPSMELERIEMALLASSRTDITDLIRLKLIRAIYSMRLERMEQQIENGESDHNEACDLILRSNYTSPSLIYWWASHPDTSIDNLRVLIQRLENEERLFNLFRAYSIANYWHSMAALETHPDQFPRLRPTYLPKDLVLHLPWEVARYKRNVRSELAQDWKTIDRLEAFHQEHEFGFGSVNEIAESPGSLISHQLDGIRIVYHYWNIEAHLFWARVTRLYLALVVWQREHGELPENLSELEGEILKKIPVSPYDGEPFYLAQNGLPETQLDKNILEALRNEWRLFRPFNDSSKYPPKGQPFIWINVYGKSSISSKPMGKVRSVNDFSDRSFQYNLEFWILPNSKPR